MANTSSNQLLDLLSNNPAVLATIGKTPTTDSIKMREALETIEKQNEALKRIAKAALSIGVIVNADKEYAMVAIGSSIYRVQRPEFSFSIGDHVVCDQESYAPIEVLEDYILPGGFQSITNIGEDWAELDVQGNVRRVDIAHELLGTLKKGDRVVLDSSQSIIVFNYGPDNSQNNVDEVPNVNWDDICGQEEAKQLIREAIEYPHTHKEIFAQYNQKASKGILLYGPPGCGKTMFAKAAAKTLADIYDGQHTSSSFIYVKGPELLDKYVGESEAKIRAIFERARKHKEEFGYPALVFIDEAEAILHRRGDHTGGSSGMADTIVPMFLAEMDGLHETGAFVMLATNRPDVLDSAVVRDGRIDRKVKVARPSPDAARAIALACFGKIPLAKGFTAEQAADIVASELYNPDHILFEVDTNYFGSRELPFREAVNGAMVTGISGYAVSLAMRRDMQTGAKKPSGVSESDVREAVLRTVDQARDLDHKEAVEEFVAEFKDDVKGIRKAKPKVKEAV